MKNDMQYVSYEKIPFPEEALQLIVREGGGNWIYSVENRAKLFHEEMEIKLFYEGSASIAIGTDTVIAQEGDVVIINPYEIHSTLPFTEQKGKYILFLLGMDFFSGDVIEGFDLRKLLIRKGISFQHLIRGNDRLRQILMRVAEEFKNQDDEYRLAIKGLMLEFFAILLREEIDETNSNIVTDEKVKYYNVIEPAIQKIRTCYREKLTLEELASLCNTSKHHFCRIFKKVTNMTVVQYVLDYRCKMADLMLTYSDKSISEIADACGYEDESYFCRCYKKKNGISPYKNKEILVRNTEGRTP